MHTVADRRNVKWSVNYKTPHSLDQQSGSSRGQPGAPGACHENFIVALLLLLFQKPYLQYLSNYATFVSIIFHSCITILS